MNNFLGQTSASVGYPPETQIAKRQTEVQENAMRVAQQIKILEESAGQLFQRLGPVIRTPPTDPLNKASAPEAVLVPLASEIRDYAKRLESINGQLGYLLANIEL